MDGRYVFYTENNVEYKTSEPLSVFVDWNNMFHIFNKVTREHVATKSRKIFVSALSRMCSQNNFKRIAVLTFCSGYDKDSFVFEAIHDSSLVESLGEKEEGEYKYYQVKALEEPYPVLNFCASYNFMYCSCRGL